MWIKSKKNILNTTLKENITDDRLKSHSTRPSMSFKVPIAKLLAFIYYLTVYGSVVGRKEMNRVRTTHAMIFFLFHLVLTTQKRYWNI